jgi:3'(2'), 5'-bisphosphate nucleotidase
MNLKVLAQSILPIAKAAGAAILDVYEKSEGIVFTKKDDDSPLTAADKAANDVICAGLEKLPTQFPIVSEENKAIDYSERKDFTYSWLVDPLDGTKEFIKRNGDFTVNIALVHNERVVLGVVYIPVTDEMYWAAKDEGAWYEKDGKEEKLNAPAFTLKDKNLGLVCSRSHLNEETQAFLDKFDEPETVSRGSSLKFLLLARGEAHIYPRLAPTMEWDTGAAQIILEEAGGRVIDNNTDAPLLYNKENLLNPFFVAYGNTELA